MFMILFVLHDPEYTEEVLGAWENAGVGGATILHSSGLGRTRRALLRDDIPIFPSLDMLAHREEEFSRTLFTVVADQAAVDRVVAGTQQVIGDLSQPDTGFLVVLPVTQAYGLDKRRAA